MKRFYLISLILIFCTSISWACADPGTTSRGYIFMLPSAHKSFSQYTDEALAQQWSLLLNTPVAVEDVGSIYWILPDNIYDSSSKIAQIAVRNNDTELIDYLTLLSQYINESKFSYNSWDYPSQQEIIEHHSKLNGIREQAKQYHGKRLNEQYLLMQMRVAFALKDWKECHKIASRANKKSVFGQLIRNLLAGALYREGEKEKAFAIYSEQGDDLSASWCGAKMGTLDGIRSFYDTNPNSPVLPWLIREFCNNLQETTDVTSDYLKKNSNNPDGLKSEIKEWFEFIGGREITEANARQFISFARNAASNGKVVDKRMWWNAAALVAYYINDYNMAAELLQKADSAPGSENDAVCSRYISIFNNIALNGNADITSPEVIENLRWIMSRRSLSDYDNLMLHRYVYNDIAPRMLKTGNYNYYLVSLATILSPVDTAITTNYYGRKWNPIYSSDFFNKLNSIPIDKLLAFYRFYNETTNDDLWRKLLNDIHDFSDLLNDVAGTRLMRLNRFAEARPFLANVSIKYINETNLTPYMAQRKFNILPWKQWRAGINFSKNETIHSNPRLEYCEMMINLGENVTQGNRAKLRENLYRLAAGYAIASINGECWWLTRYFGHSANTFETPDWPDSDFDGIAIQLLHQASNIFSFSSDNTSPSDAEIEFALASITPGNVFTYDYKKGGDVLNRFSMRTCALIKAVKAVRESESYVPAYITNCDDFRAVAKEFPVIP